MPFRSRLRREGIFALRRFYQPARMVRRLDNIRTNLKALVRVKLACLRRQGLKRFRVELSPLSNCRNSASGISNSAKPQSRQITTVGNNISVGFVKLSYPGEWMLISPEKTRCLVDWHDLQCIGLSSFAGAKWCHPCHKSAVTFVTERSPAARTSLPLG